ncbi:MAG: site-specific integrase [Rhodocyclales bacterium GT-UBC]|nr:MAG: site-specific integrase [Rhodocyclales bacterium GT-UBC]
MGNLTDVQLQAWVRSGLPLSGKSDGGGLTFTLTSKGTASWVFRYRFHGKGREYTIGGYPDISLASARKIATKLRAEVDAGTDVAAEKQNTALRSRQTQSFKQLSDAYLHFAVHDLRESTHSEVRRYLDKDILPRIGGLPAPDVTEREIVDLVSKVASRSASVARRVFEITSVILAFGVARHAVSRNPCSNLKVSAILGKPKARRARVMLTEEELKLIFIHGEELGEDNLLMLKVLLATCTRKSELLKARWSDIDFQSGIWHLPGDNVKTARPYDIPLAPQVLVWLSKLKVLADGSEHVLPARKRGYGSRAETANKSTLNEAIRRNQHLLGGRKFSPHDLRSTAASYLKKLGMGILEVERCLNHSLGGLVEVYDKNDYMAQRREGLEHWASYLAELEKTPVI